MSRSGGLCRTLLRAPQAPTAVTHPAACVLRPGICRSTCREDASAFLRRSTSAAICLCLGTDGCPGLRGRTSCRRRGSTGIGITEYSRRTTGCEKPSRRWRKGNVGKPGEAATGGHGSDGYATEGCCDANHATQKPRSHDTSRIAWAKLMPSEDPDPSWRTAQTSARLAGSWPAHRLGRARPGPLISWESVADVPLAGLSVTRPSGVRPGVTPCSTASCTHPRSSPGRSL